MVKGMHRLFTAFVAFAVLVTACPSFAFALGNAGGAGSGIVVLDTPTDSLSVVAPEATSYSNLKAAGLKFDFKPGKTFRVYSYLRGADPVPYNVRMSTPKIVSAGAGKKKATFTVSYTLANLTTKQRNGLFKSIQNGYSGNALFGSRFFNLVDYNTGLSLMNPTNKFGVKVTTSSASSTTQKYTASDGAWFTLQKQWKVKFTVTYPSTYKAMCLGVGATTYAYKYHNQTSKNFSKKGSKIKYYKTLYYTKCKANSHFMRIR